MVWCFHVAHDRSGRCRLEGPEGTRMILLALSAIPADYPMVAPAYARARSELVKGMGLGQRRRNG